MKRILSIIITLLLIFKISPVSHAQETPPLQSYDEAYEEYRAQYETYQTAHNDYLLARSRYFTYGTLVSQEEALNKTKTFMIERNNVLSAYADMLKFTNVDPSLEQIIIQEKSFFDTHTQTIPAIGTLNDAAISGTLIAKHYPLFQLINQRVLTSIFVKRFEDAVAPIDAYETKIAALIINLDIKGIDTLRVKRGTADIQNKLLLARTHLDNGRKLKTQNASREQIQTSLFASQQYYRETLVLYKELLHEIKYGTY